MKEAMEQFAAMMANKYGIRRQEAPAPAAPEVNGKEVTI